MNIKVVFFASLREKIGESAVDINLDSTCSVADLWKQVAVNGIDDQVLCAVNQEFSTYEHQLQDGDEVAFFPPVTGG